MIGKNGSFGSINCLRFLIDKQLDSVVASVIERKN